MIKTFKWNDLELEYLHIDNKKDKNLIFVHGFGSEFAFFEPLFNSFANEYNIWGLNMLASGKSQYKPEVMKFLTFCDIFDAWIKEINVDNLYLFGHSMGGGISMSAVLKNSKKIKKIALVGPMSRSGLTRVKEFDECFFPLNTEEWKKLVNLCYYDPSKLLNDENKLKQMDKYFATHQEELRNIYALGRILPSLENMDRIDEGIKNAKMPVGLFIGAYDGIIDFANIANYYHSVNKDVQVFEFQKAGHSIWLEDFDNFIDTLKDFYAN
ncbi:alpha/beta fold hydrolase [Mycoplasma sp. 3341]|uniref:alpha/beta fold hydrolase n=1 Tax=Mycoplasma sp. 3341 TaxID=3447506 RepID=UPI003F65C8E4